jgi:tetratricopeptide (TPR) repeat protein
MFEGHFKRPLQAPDLVRHLGKLEYGRAWALRACACRRLRRLEDARDAWEEALRLCPHDGWILPRFAVWQLDRGRFAQALDTAVRGLELASRDDQPGARLVRGQALWLCSHPFHALTDFTIAAREAPLNSPVQLCAVLNIAAVLAHSSLANENAASLVLDLASTLRSALGTRKLPRIRALLRWATGLAHCARGRRMAGARDLHRAREAFLQLDDAATAAAVTLDYGAATGRPVAPLLRKILEDAPCDTEEQTLAILAGLASGRAADPRQRQHLTSLALASNVRRRRQL